MHSKGLLSNAMSLGKREGLRLETTDGLASFNEIVVMIIGSFSMFSKCIDLNLIRICQFHNKNTPKARFFESNFGGVVHIRSYFYAFNCKSSSISARVLAWEMAPRSLAAPDVPRR